MLFWFSFVFTTAKCVTYIVSIFPLLSCVSPSQVMPQLLNYLKADSLGHSVDWGILTVFTCAESCSLGSGYAEEFVWKQDFADTR